VKKHAKPASSTPISNFLFAVEHKKIIAFDDARAQRVLNRLVEALKAIQSGEPPDEALSVERRKGPEPDPHTLRLAALIEIAKERGDNWATIEYLAEQLRKKSGLEIVSRERWMALHKKHRTLVQSQIEAVRKLRTVGADKRDAQVSKWVREISALERFVVDPDRELRR
jgi:hypothetical protein